MQGCRTASRSEELHLWLGSPSLARGWKAQPNGACWDLRHCKDLEARAHEVGGVELDRLVSSRGDLQCVLAQISRDWVARIAGKLQMLRDGALHPHCRWFQIG